MAENKTFVLHPKDGFGGLRIISVLQMLIYKVSLFLVFVSNTCPKTSEVRTGESLSLLSSSTLPHSGKVSLSFVLYFP